jgi:hypothetical protein
MYPSRHAGVRSGPPGHPALPGRGSGSGYRHRTGSPLRSVQPRRVPHHDDVPAGGVECGRNGCAAAGGGAWPATTLRLGQLPCAIPARRGSDPTAPSSTPRSGLPVGRPMWPTPTVPALHSGFNHHLATMLQRPAAGQCMPIPLPRGGDRARMRARPSVSRPGRGWLAVPCRVRVAFVGRPVPSPVGAGLAHCRTRLRVGSEAG